ncbi:hypothetical protein KY495_11510 [Massilia sp. PAMC28688]|uniref:cytochrome-c peroxidase n=1 Tax=Massilia sp. PAMC28688 TaxID=2861283 RepID=UPI001C62A395|nr:cytochrome c peroxidase [Massilia sp. PAMC28688]QYF95717.1 hypothetical protein KY495_11510 [Massilia sp. PAMC28688]
MKALLPVCLVVQLALLGACQPPPAIMPGPALGLPALPPAPRGADTAAAVELGRKLFMDRRLSHNNTMSCAMCHIPEQGFTATQLGTALGLEGRTLRRNAPTLLNVAYVQPLFHDGRAESLHLQAWDPLLNPIEMGNPDSSGLIDKLRRMPDYDGLFEAAFDGAQADRRTVGLALASYQRTLVAGNSRFDRWHYGKQAHALTPQEQAGFKIFTGKGRCVACHAIGKQHALFTDGRFHNTGVGLGPRAGSHRVRLAAGIDIEVTAQSLASVSEPLQADLGRYEVTRLPAHRYAYRTPGLRNVALTAPYMHDGSLASLEDVVAFYQRGGIDNPARDPLLRPLQLGEQEKADLSAFLRSLTGDKIDALAAAARRGSGGHPLPPDTTATARRGEHDSPAGRKAMGP